MATLKKKEPTHFGLSGRRNSHVPSNQEAAGVTPPGTTEQALMKADE